MITRDCDCDHEFPVCCCALGYTGESLRYHSRVASSIVGWPSLNYDADALAEHNAAMAAAWEERARIDAMNQEVPQAPRAAKLRVSLGVDQRTIPPADCVPCQQQAALASTDPPG